MVRIADDAWLPDMAVLTVATSDGMQALDCWMTAADAMMAEKSRTGDISDASYGGPDSPLSPLHFDWHSKWSTLLEARRDWAGDFDLKTVKKEKTGRLATGIDSLRAAHLSLGVAWLARVAAFQDDFRFAQESMQLITPSMRMSAIVLQTLMDITQGATARPLMNMFPLAQMAQEVSQEKSEQFKPLWERLQFYVPWLDGGETPRDPNQLWA